MLNDRTNGTHSTADLWRIGQQSRSVYLGFWLRNLFQKLRLRSLEQSGQDTRAHRIGVVARGR